MTSKRNHFMLNYNFYLSSLRDLKGYPTRTFKCYTKNAVPFFCKPIEIYLVPILSLRKQNATRRICGRLLALRKC